MSTKPEEVDNLTSLAEVLEAHQRQGRYLDSGQFGLDAVKALTKLSQHQLGDTGLWLVKLVQAAVVAQAERLDVTFERRRVKVKFQPNQGWQADELLHSMLSGRLPEERALLHLLTGLRSCAGHLTETLSWSCGQTRVTLEGSRARVEPQSESPFFELEATRPARSFTLSGILTRDIGHLVRQTATEYEVLTQRCWTCPIPIVIDGRLMDRGYDKVVRSSVAVRLQPHISKRTSEVHACLGLRHLTSTNSRPKLVALRDDEEGEPIKVTSPLYAHETFLHWPAPVSRGAVAIHASPFITASVELVLDGVVVEAHPLEKFQARPSKVFGLQASTRTLLRPRLIFALTPDEVDLSGFQTRGLNVDALVEQAIPEMVELLHEIANHGRSLTYLVSTRPSSKLLTPLTLPLRITHAPIYRRVMMTSIQELLLAIKDAVESPSDDGGSLGEAGAIE